MTESIIVFDIPEPEINPARNTRQLEYDQYRLEPRVPIAHYDAFEEAEIAGEERRPPNTTLLPMICAWIANYCVPIVDHVYDTLSAAAAAESSVQDSQHYFIETQLTRGMQAYCRQTAQYLAVPADFPIKISGFQIPRVFSRVADQSEIDHNRAVPLAQSFATGTFALRSFQTKQYFRHRDELDNFGLPLALTNDTDVHFDSEAQAEEVIRGLFTAIESLHSTDLLGYPITSAEQESQVKNATDSSTTSTTSDADSDTDSETGSKTSKTSKTSTTNKQKHIPRAYQSHQQPRAYQVSRIPFVGQPPNDQVVELTARSYGNQRDPFTVTTYPAATYDLVSIVFLDNEANYSTKRATPATSNAAIDDRIAEIAAAYAKAMEKRTATRALVKKHWAAAKQRGELNACAKQKFNRPIAQISAQQLAACERQVQQALQQREANRKLPITALFNKLRSAVLDIEPDELRAAVDEAQKLKPPPDDEMYPGGNCPHVLCRAKVTLEHFGKPSQAAALMSDCVELYTLPLVDQQYFCRLCGELLATADNNAEERKRKDTHAFVSQDDPLMNMIWKELMYTIGTYVRFATPTPLRPLVNGLAVSLRPIIATHETALLKSRTASSENIRDTLILYASIYSYAAISAMIMEEPNRVQFGREKSTTAISTTSETKSSDYHKSDSGRHHKTHGRGEHRARLSHDDRRRVERLVRYQHKARRGGLIDERDKKRYESTVLTTALNLILINKGPIIRRIKHMTADVVKQIFLKTAYAWARRSIHRQEPQKLPDTAKQTWPEMDELFNYVEVYTHITRAAQRNAPAPALKSRSTNAEVKRGGRQSRSKSPVQKSPRNKSPASHKPPKSPRAKESLAQLAQRTAELVEPTDITQASYDRRVERLMGRSLEEIATQLKRNISPWATCSMPQWTAPEEKSVAAVILGAVAKKNAALGKDMAAELFAYYADGFSSAAQAAVDQLHRFSRVPMHPKFTAYLETYEKIAHAERRLHKAFAAVRQPPQFSVRVRRNVARILNRFDPDSLVMSQFYCKNGEHHVPGRLVMRGADGKLTPMKRAEIVALIAADPDKYKSLELVDEQCDLCAQYIRTAAVHGNRKAFAAKLATIASRLAFYQYYESRCPEGSLHVIHDDRCKQCGALVEQLGRKQIDPDEPDDYYERYSEAFDEIQEHKMATLRLAVEQTDRVARRTIRDCPQPQPSGHRFILSHVAEWSQAMNIPYNTLVNIGLSEGIKYADIKAGRQNPSKVRSDGIAATNLAGHYLQCAAKLKSYILHIIRDFSLVLRSEISSTLPITLKDILAKQKQGPGLAHIAEYLPHIGHDFAAQDSAHQDDPPELYANWLLDYLATQILTLLNTQHSQFKTLATQLARYFTTGILADEQHFSLPIPVFRARGANLADHTDSSDTEISGEEFDQRADEQRAHSDQSGEERDESEAPGDLNEAFDVENLSDIWDTE